MNERFLHISFTFNEGMPKVQGLEPVFNYLAPDWLRYSPNCWLVWTARPASDFYFGVKPLIGNSDSMLIVKVDMSDRNGIQPQWVWEWMDKKRVLGPPPPPAAPPADFGQLLGIWGDPPPKPGGLGSLFGGLIEPPKPPKK
ncbi:hypothetical protein [Bradyrhizobium japonicum]|jgi:hypothetical protein|uniref:hypothetical protein n=1 Tax=Bradyrhizobium japonicum TaxID=375 RepID=UPI0020A13590|nr:hypothetical protein [Bradyrhizobium japonicum]MCP1766316.1 hypothetical protein [Bradyrhizobium japonicum]MCP1788454.1 hypothetical protein [Bradyrhizobium japonicum]MCP1810329.1 hypothetical protein [Bradyrhizobium japonicum]MCP1819263.1 hypothetical protein [Bradyrhizobium japonicum]MCP1869227.1 hypothetical protein [Bradyrhizobium japonicum]